MSECLPQSKEKGLFFFFFFFWCEGPAPLYFLRSFFSLFCTEFYLHFFFFLLNGRSCGVWKFPG